MLLIALQSAGAAHLQIGAHVCHQVGVSRVQRHIPEEGVDAAAAAAAAQQRIRHRLRHRATAAAGRCSCCLVCARRHVEAGDQLLAGPAAAKVDDRAGGAAEPPHVIQCQLHRQQQTQQQ